MRLSLIWERESFDDDRDAHTNDLLGGAANTGRGDACLSQLQLFTIYQRISCVILTFKECTAFCWCTMSISNPKFKLILCTIFVPFVSTKIFKNSPEIREMY